VAPHLSVVVPAYNEAQRIGSTLARIRQYFEKQSYPVELIVVDDGSRDETVVVARRALEGFPRGEVISYKPNRGKGHAVRTGIVATTGDYVLFTDADLSTPIEEVEHAFGLLTDGHDMVLGSRASGTTVVRKQPLFRQLAARFFNLVRDTIVPSTGVSDSQCGFKLFRGPVARDIFRRQRVDRFMFDVETLYIASRLGYRYVEMPVAWADVPGSKVRVIRGALELLPELLSIRLRHGHLKPANRGT
jgi:dolichyl-phosphate beta-glucosyltransferase